MSKQRENFVRLAEARTNKALKIISIIGNLSNRNNYQYDQKDVAKIFSALEQEINKTKLRFQSQLKATKDAGFKLE